MGRFEASIVATIGFLAVLATAFYVPAFTEFYVISSWFGLFVGFFLATNGMMKKNRLGTYFGAALMANLAVGVGFHVAAWPLVIGGSLVVIACFFLARLPAKK